MNQSVQLIAYFVTEERSSSAVVLLREGPAGTVVGLAFEEEARIVVPTNLHLLQLSRLPLIHRHGADKAEQEQKVTGYFNGYDNTRILSSSIIYKSLEKNQSYLK